MFVDCQQNLLASIRTRVTQARVVPAPSYLPVVELAELLAADFRQGCEVDHIDPLDFEEWNSRWPPGKQATMRDALTRVPRWSKMAFTKAEFVKPGDPRNIVCSDPSVLARLGPITSGFDHALKRHPAAIKGYDFAERAKKMVVLRNYSHWMNSDYSRFDKSLSTWVLKVESEFYRIMCPAVHSEPWLAEALTRNYLPVRAASWRGVFYRTPAMRGTGDANTALGNWLLNRLAFLLLMRKYPEMECFIEGDDAIVGFNHDPDAFVAEFQRITYWLGYKTKAYASDDLERTPFCGRYLTAFGAPRTVPVVFGYLFKWHVSKRTVYTQPEAKALLRFKTMSYLAMEPSTPVVAAIAEFFLRILPDATLPTPEYLKVLKDNRWHMHRRKPTAGERQVVWKNSGITPDMQIEMENYFDHLDAMPEKFPDFVDFIPPSLGNVEVCPLPPPWFTIQNVKPCPLSLPGEGPRRNGPEPSETGPANPRPSHHLRRPPGCDHHG